MPDGHRGRSDLKHRKGHTEHHLEPLARVHSSARLSIESLTFSSVIGALALPRIPTPFQAPDTRHAVIVATGPGTDCSRAAPSPFGASVDTTYPLAWPAEVTNDLLARDVHDAVADRSRG